MRYSIIPLDSYTTSRKAVSYLSGRGIRAYVVKTGYGRNGCGFGIRTAESPETVCRILSGAGIRCGRPLPPGPHPGPRPGRRPF
ncbi:MAG: hypothetical protein J6X60_12255 [Ruminiclostridium sp.]|nr:hypothetical protein [Ruminiclostridium sp.]